MEQKQEIEQCVPFDIGRDLNLIVIFPFDFYDDSSKSKTRHFSHFQQKLTLKSLTCSQKSVILYTDATKSFKQEDTMLYVVLFIVFAVVFIIWQHV